MRTGLFSVTAHFFEKQLVCLSDGRISSLFFILNGSFFFTGRHLRWMFHHKPWSSYWPDLSITGPTRLPTIQCHLLFFNLSRLPLEGQWERQAAAWPRFPALAPKKKKKKRLIIDSGTFLSLIDRIGTTQRLSSTTFIYVGGSIFHTGHQKTPPKKTLKGSSGSFDVDSHRTNQQWHKDTLMLKGETSGSAKEVEFGLQAARPPGNDAALWPQYVFVSFFVCVLL